MIPGRHFYIDLSDENQDGWFWKSNGEPATFFDWDEGEPDGGEYCAAISTNAHDHGRWIDLQCDSKFASPLCEIGEVIFTHLAFAYFLILLNLLA